MKVQLSSYFDAILILTDGTYFLGKGIGKKGTKALGEMCFNTSMTGYQEILTDPSYCGQIINFTFPHIGNVGCNKNDNESKKPYCAGLIIRNNITTPSNYRATIHLNSFLIKHHLVGIAHIDTRLITNYLRQFGLQNGLIYYGKPGEVVDMTKLKKEVASHPPLSDMELTKLVTTAKNYVFDKGLFDFQKQQYITYKSKKSPIIKVAVLDFGIKKNILHYLVDKGLTIKVFRSTSSYNDIMKWQPDGFFLSNGPGDPFPTSQYTYLLLKQIIKEKVPTFGICLGHQLLSITTGLKTIKMSQGHRGVNHPVKNIQTGEIEITSQNHGFCVANEGIPSNVKITHISLFDDTIDGICYTDRPIFAVQYHPESSAGPHDSKYLFDKFISLLKESKLKKAKQYAEKK